MTGARVVNRSRGAEHTTVNGVGGGTASQPTNSPRSRGPSLPADARPPRRTPSAAARGVAVQHAGHAARGSSSTGAMEPPDVEMRDASGRDGTVGAAPNGGAPAPAPNHHGSHQAQLASAIRLHPGVIQSNWHTSTDSKTEFDVGETELDPNMITTRVTTVTTTTTVTTFTSARTRGMIDLAHNPAPIPNSVPSTPEAHSGVREAGGPPGPPLPPPLQGPVSEGSSSSSSKQTRTINGTRPRVSFAPDSKPDESEIAEARQNAQGSTSSAEEKADGKVTETGAQAEDTTMEDGSSSQTGAGDEANQETEAQGSGSGPVSSPESSGSRRRKDDDSENGAAGGASGQSAASPKEGSSGGSSNAGGSAKGAGTRSQQGSRQSSEASGSKHANTLKRPRSALRSPQGSGLVTRGRSSGPAPSTDNYSPVLNARVVRKHKANLASTVAASPSRERPLTRKVVSSSSSSSSTASAPAKSSTAAAVTAEPEPKRSRRVTLAAPAAAPIAEEPSRNGRVLSRRSTGSAPAAAASTPGPSSTSSAAAAPPRQSARIKEGMAPGSQSNSTSGQSQSAGQGEEKASVEAAKAGADESAEPTSWRDKVFLNSGIYSDDFRAGRSRKRKRKRANMERRKLAAEKRARIAAATTQREREAEDSESEDSISSLSELSESEEEIFLPEDTALPLPEHYGFFLLLQDREFRLTYPILVEADEMRARADAKKKPRPYVQIPTNRYVTRPKLAGEVPVCQCKLPPPLTAAQKAANAQAKAAEGNSDDSDQPLRRGCGEDCINRQLQYVCDPRKCPCGDECSNLSLGKRPAPKLEVHNYGARGFGLRTPVALKKHQFLGEYRGEVIDLVEASRRTRENYVKDGNFYLLDYDSQAGEVLDAGMKGSIIRFANHSCQPNCYVMRWTICGTDEQLTAEFQIGMYALRDIEAGEELTYDYGWSEFRSKVSAEVTTPIRCLCGAPNCTGTFGGNKKGGSAEPVLARSGMGSAAKEKKEKALRQQKRRASTAAGGGADSPAPSSADSPVPAATPTPTAMPVPSAAPGSSVPDVTGDAGAPGSKAGTAAATSGSSASAAGGQSNPSASATGTQSTTVDVQSSARALPSETQTQQQSSARQGPIRPMPAISSSASNSQRSFRPSSVTAAATANAIMLAASAGGIVAAQR